jgi:hypothetical protein
LSCFFPNEETGAWWAEDSAGNRTLLADAVQMEKGWQHAEIPMRLNADSDFLGIGDYRLIWKGTSDEYITRMSIQAKEEEEE